MAALLLAEANNMEARIQQRDAGWAKHHGGTSGEHGHWCNFRRISYYGAKWDVIDLPLLFGRALLDKKEGGLLKFDYISTSRAPESDASVALSPPVPRPGERPTSASAVESHAGVT